RAFVARRVADGDPVYREALAGRGGWRRWDRVRGEWPAAGPRRGDRVPPATGAATEIRSPGRDAKPGTERRGVMTAIALMCCFVSVG
ncbi:hypothetical protein ABZW26_23625, partial [Streptomyces sp. NPDC004623]